MSSNNDTDSAAAVVAGTPPAAADAEDNLDDLLKDAENLMNDLGTDVQVDGDDDVVETVDLGGFSIDSDDEGELAGTATPVEDHPLSEGWLAAPAAPTASTPTSGTSVPTSNHHNTSGTSNFSTNMAGVYSSASPMAGQALGELKQQTTRFASGLASIAQRAAQQVAVATAPVQVSNSSAAAPTAHNHVLPLPSISNNDNNNSIHSSTQPELDNSQKSKLLQDHVGQLLPGEPVIMFLSNLLHVSDSSGVSFLASANKNSGSEGDRSVMWCCAMTYYRVLLFSTAATESLQIPCATGWSPVCWPATPNAIKRIEIPLGSLEKVEKTVYQAGASSFMGLVLKSKDSGRIIRFTTPSYADTGRALDSLNTYAFPGKRNLGYLFAFESKRQQVMDSVVVAADGQQSITLPPCPKRFDPMVEYPRLLHQTGMSNPPWSLWASLNNDYSLSPTYPSVLVGPATLDETKAESQHVIRQCAKFRSEARLPALTWCGSGGASIWRCSQPKVGLQGNRSPADELFLRHVAESARGANAMAEAPPVYPRSILQQLTGDYSKDWIPEPGCGLKILDLRPRSSAMANRTGGYGYENTSNYPNTTIQFCNIQNIHAVRDSFQKLMSICHSSSTSDANFASLVEDSKWLSHVRTILQAGWETAYWVHVWRMPVILHCSHGWDRTSQVAGVAQLLLDPHYRTRDGLARLIEKDFLSFGHPFHTRCAHGEGKQQDNASGANMMVDEGQISPIFLQFLDSVWQLIRIYPDCFEFNANYLRELSHHIYTCRFGTLLCDTEREREVLAGIRLRTYSVWDYLDEREDCKNPNYQPSDGVLLMPLSILLRSVTLWTDKHCEYSPKPTSP